MVEENEGSTKMVTIKIFLASSSQLKDDRLQLEIFINRKNKEWTRKGVFLELVIWEDFLDALSQTRLQDEYNKAIKQCDIFVTLFFTKVGKYTAEEFDTAYRQFKTTGKPLVYTYFKDPGPGTAEANHQDIASRNAFQEKLRDLGHFYTRYQNSEGLCLHFGGQLNKLAEQGLIPGAAPGNSSTGKNTTFYKQKAEKIYNINHIDKADFQ
jgi:hypothetical protein